MLAAVAALLVPTGEAESAKRDLPISGRAYAFNHMDTFLAGATIRVRELPGLSATTDATGDYVLEVPDDTNVTPYIDPPPGYHQIDLQTFHPRGEPIENANFQTPGDAEYNGLAALLQVPFGPDGRPEQCAIAAAGSSRFASTPRSRSGCASRCARTAGGSARAATPRWPWGTTASACRSRALRGGASRA